MAKETRPKMSDDNSDLRRKAKEVFQKQHGDLAKITPTGIQRIVHELQVHQIELEMQNDELRRTQQELQTSRDKYFDLYDLAPMGYVTVNENGIILEANLTVAGFLGQDRSSLIKQPLTSFINKEDQDIYYRYRKRLSETSDHLDCEVRMQKGDGTQFWANFGAAAVRGDSNNPAYRMTIIDITRRKQAENRIQHLASFPQLNPNPVIEVNAAGVVVFSNVATQKVLSSLGMDQNDTNVFLPSDFHVILKDLDEKEDISYYRELAIRDRVFSEAIYLTPQFSVARIYALDITERKQAEELHGRLASIVESAQDAIIGEDLNNIILTWNVGAQNIFGYKAEEIIGKSVSLLIPPGQTDEVPELLARIKQGEHIENFETVRVRKDGTIIHVSLTLSAVKDATGRIIGVSKIARDISKRRQEECRRALSAEILRTLNDPPEMEDAIDHIVTAIKRGTGFEAVGIRLHRGEDFPYAAQDGFSNDFLLTENILAVRNQDGGICNDKDGNISLECTCGLVISGRTDPANPVFTQMGSFWTNESFVLSELPVDQDPRLRPRNRCIHEGFHSVALIPLRAGKQIIGLLQLNDRRPNQFTPELISFFEDLAAIIGIALSRKQAEDTLKKAKRLSDSLNLELEAANEDLKAFIYSVSHDLRAPLRHMTGFAKLLQKRLEGQQDEKSLKFARVISDASSKMERLIDGLLSYTRLGREEMPKEEVNLSHLLKESIEEISEETMGRDIIWRLGELPTVYCEPSMLKLVLSNFISNAVKFTSTRSKAEIEIACNKGENEVVCFVKDNGAGFDMKHVDRLFGVFQRLHTQEEFEGTGIGLANVRRIISLHGGRTWAEGAVGQGATFYFTLPKLKRTE